MQTFFDQADYQEYVHLMQRELELNGVACWAWCLMPNHVHWLLVPSEREGLSDAMREAHRLYALRLNRRKGWRGHLWENRFWSYVMSSDRLMNCARYIEQNPVRARLVANAEDWSWSSAAAHLSDVPDGLTDLAPIRDLAGDYEAFLRKPIPAKGRRLVEAHLRTGRPAGPRAFVSEVAQLTGLPLLDPAIPRPGAAWPARVAPLAWTLEP